MLSDDIEAIEAIIARNVKAALNEAADEIDAERYYDVAAMQLKNSHAALLRKKSDCV